MLTDRHLSALVSTDFVLSPRELKGLTPGHQAVALVLADQLPNVVDALRSMAQELLLVELRYLSERHADVAWAPLLEYSAWGVVLNGGQKMTEEETARLRRLADWAGGWYHLPDGKTDPEFIAAEEWAPKYEAFLKYEESRRR